MIPTPCDDCRLSAHCPGYNRMHMRAGLAWARGEAAPQCPSYQPRWFRGIEGVIDHTVSPHPSRGYKQRLNSHHA
jgi:hypothetical protein